MLTAGEDDDFQVVELWETVTPESVQTPREVYAALAGARLFQTHPFEKSSQIAPLIGPPLHRRLTQRIAAGCELPSIYGQDRGSSICTITLQQRICTACSNAI